VRRLVSVTVILILAATSACDNVSWGGVDIHVVPPPPAAVGVPGTADLDIGEQRMPQGPVLYHVIFDGVRATMTPIGELDGERCARSAYRRTEKRTPAVSSRSGCAAAPSSPCSTTACARAPSSCRTPSR
jgi:hypothetical protein